MPNYFINIADTPSDIPGKTWRQKNAEQIHNIKIGSLVELNCEDCEGVRMYVVHHARDCDQTPLYYLCHDKTDTTEERKGFKNDDWIGGFSEQSLKVIK